MIKKLLVISTATMIMFSPMVFARGGNGSGKAYRGSMSQGTASQSRTQIKAQTQTRTQSRSKLRDGSGTIASGAKGSGDMIREKRQDKLQDGSCKE